MLSKKDKGSFFRIAIKGGGCSGFQYDFSFDDKQDEDDLKHENILIDKKSAELLKGSEIDYVKEAGIREIGIIINANDNSIQNVFGNGENLKKNTNQPASPLT